MTFSNSIFLSKVFVLLSCFQRKRKRTIIPNFNAHKRIFMPKPFIVTPQNSGKQVNFCTRRIWKYVDTFRHNLYLIDVCSVQLCSVVTKIQQHYRAMKTFFFSFSVATLSQIKPSMYIYSTFYMSLPQLDFGIFYILHEYEEYKMYLQ